MKRLILTLTLLTIGFICNAQYNPYYNPYLYAAIAAETDDTYRLNNIRFDENAIKQNPEAWDNYLNYLSINANYSKTYRTYSIVGWSGVGIMLASLIPLLSSDSDSSLAWGCGLLGAGTIVSSVGLDQAWWTGITIAAMLCLFLVIQSVVMARKNRLS